MCSCSTLPNAQCHFLSPLPTNVMYMGCVPCCPPLTFSAALHQCAMWPLHGDVLVWYHRVAWGPWRIYTLEDIYSLSLYIYIYILLQDIYHFQLRYSGPQICVFFYPFLVTRSGVWLLVGQKPVKRQVWWKVCFILDAGNWSGGGQTPIQRWTLSLAPATPNDNQWTRAFIDRGRGLHLETVLTVILKLVSSDPTSVILIKYSRSSVPGSVCSQFLEASSWNSGS